jgi:hypothetical protein
VKAAAICLVLAACGGSAMKKGPVVIELFTSQGCSTCPPADRFLASLAPGDELGGRPVIPLAFHVDYWNDLGWADPFSTAAWTQRQASYGGNIYTPEVVVAGRADTIGSHRREIEELVKAAPPTTELDASAAFEDGAVRVTANPPAGTTAWAAIVEDGIENTIHAGENKGATAHDDHIVRALVQVDGTATIPLDPAWHHPRVVAFAQANDGTIVAARAL